MDVAGLGSRGYTLEIEVDLELPGATSNAIIMTRTLVDQAALPVTVEVVSAAAAAAAARRRGERAGSSC